MTREYTLLDRALMGADRSLKTLVKGSSTAQRHSPAQYISSSLNADEQRRHAAGLMRINHTGEVCAQALYQGQALTAKNAQVKAAMEHSANEEIDHLAWCEQRLKELDSHTSHLNPLFYAASFAIGAAAGAISDRISLGFVAATEDQVCEHLREHLQTLPADDEKSRAILQQMLEDEAEHASKAIEAGGQVFPSPVKKAMSLMSKVMTGSTYYV
ncbi:2-polyprenyl-3-methyl-6-methoxy-1,4-benzoquinone monooxygenase [Zhongshania aliphaticivorans]|uniref:2-polyprenyl-3-methyl-6-methoxy-1,4-benzoquinone monooxygenase n=1 Tax=Zhongshania aliphaticivorans TaxID=1470434 RepID=UPI0012E54274|nr:2-polyprenyl-3-methyl-6-methoxy-1,4-benzoquinone monooxygenase [Zhongshania aliphaticivorans]CAA0097202.1 2-nonaprenyl-3-methyl-6-methoxy-1,4-benzoquinol hydroxylase [Zhongshania aliphaticivorans]